MDARQRHGADDFSDAHGRRAPRKRAGHVIRAHGWPAAELPQDLPHLEERPARHLDGQQVGRERQHRPRRLGDRGDRDSS